MREPSQTPEKELWEGCPGHPRLWLQVYGDGYLFSHFFAFLAEHISNSIQRESGIPECAGALRLAPDLGAEDDWAAFVLEELLLRVLHFLFNVELGGYIFTQEPFSSGLILSCLVVLVKEFPATANYSIQAS